MKLLIIYSKGGTQMLNEVILVGRLVDDLKQIKKPPEKITIETIRGYKNANGLYDSDLIEVQIWRGISQTLMYQAHQGSLITIKGRLEQNQTKMEIVAEKVSLLDSYVS